MTQRYTNSKIPPIEAIEAYYAALRPYWHPVLPASALPANQPVAVELLGEAVVLARLDGQVIAMQDLCRHFQAQLSLGTIEPVAAHGDCLRCPYHGWAYAADGRCVDIPQLAAGRTIPREARVPTYQVQEHNDLIWVCLAAAPRFPLPEFPEASDPAFHSGPLRTYAPWAAAAPRVIMGTLDDTHFPWVHPGVLDDRANVAPPAHRVWRDDRFLMTQYTVQQPTNVTVADGETQQAMQEVTYTNYVALPTSIRLLKDSADGKRYAIWLAVCPRRFDMSDTYWRVARNYDLDPANDATYEAFEDMVREQDRPIVESQRPWLLPPLWSKLELPLRPADEPLIAYQRWLEELDITIAI